MGNFFFPHFSATRVTYLVYYPTQPRDAYEKQ